MEVPLTDWTTLARNLGSLRLHTNIVVEELRLYAVDPGPARRVMHEDEPRASTEWTKLRTARHASTGGASGDEELTLCGSQNH